MASNRKPNAREKINKRDEHTAAPLHDRVISRFGPETLAPAVFVIAGFEALCLLFALPARWHGTPDQYATLIVIATTILLAGLIQVLTALIRWWAMRGKI